MRPKVNRWLDLLDRSLWTGLATAAAATITALSLDLSWDQSLAMIGLTTLGTVCKVIVGQNTGTDDTGSLIGTPVIEPSPTADK